MCDIDSCFRHHISRRAQNIWSEQSKEIQKARDLNNMTQSEETKTKGEKMKGKRNESSQIKNITKMLCGIQNLPARNKGLSFWASGRQDRREFLSN